MILKALDNISDITKLFTVVADVIKIIALLIIIIKFTSFGNNVIDNLDKIENMNEEIIVLLENFKNISSDIASEEFRDKADDVTESIVDVKENFLNKIKGK